MKNEVKVTFRGWPGHFCCSEDCIFRLNTLLEYKKIKIVVSTVGLLYDNKKNIFTTVGVNRYFETMAFHAQKKFIKHPNQTIGFWDADVLREIHFDSEWAYSSVEDELKANEGHYNVIEEIKNRLLNGDQFK